MTEFETATLAYQATTLTYQYAGLWVSGGVGAAQCLLIGFGLLVMHRSAERRDRQQAAAMAADAKRHEQFMTALDKRHDDAMAADNKRHEEFMAALEKQRADALNADAKRHEEFMAALEKRHDETMSALSKGHEETMAALSNNR